MPRPRDNQRQRLYDAEDAAAVKITGSHWKQTIKNADLQAYVNKVYDRATFRRRWPNARVVKVSLGKGGGWAWDHGNEIRLGVVARNEWVVLHEIAHILTPNEYAAHGPEFAGIFLWLVEDNLGKAAADAVRAEFKTRRVRKSLKAVPNPIGREEERLVKIRDAARSAVRKAEADLAAAQRALNAYRQSRETEGRRAVA